MTGSPAPAPPRAGTERGSVTAELALALPAVVGLLVVVLLLASAATSQLRCADAARAGARAAALGEDRALVVAIAQRVAGQGATVTVEAADPWVTVTVRRPLSTGPLGGAGLTAAGRATARVEP
ncbi:TadE family type IV pilus minor pilin [Cellulomonas aerilata]|uniref:TadE-like domain-containing protein n=1 Tax=Cellulomonas aerilata TaxID=515326 RepID=A0A512DFI5_9CELL|nr:TadE family type IV pilus minor pilin [Cellulomonas aerilata]GEO34980.1 hypothetical protein CAE01nite_27050 [Cellulomonas aerilata]